MLEALAYVIGVLSATGIGWILHGRWKRRRGSGGEQRLEATVEDLENQLALERLRVLSYAHMNGVDLEPSSHLAPRPARSPDSADARA